MNPVISQDYQSFMTNNRIKVNQYLNRILWLFTLAGPAIAVGVDAGIFPDITFRFAVYERVRAYRAGYPDRLYGVLPCKHPSDVVPCASPEHFVLRPDAVFLYAVSELYPDA